MFIFTVLLTLTSTWSASERAGRQTDRRRAGANHALSSKCSDSSTPDGEEENMKVKRLK